MQYLEYIQTDGGCWFDTNIVPDINTKLEAYITPLNNGVSWNGFIGAQNADDDNSTFQIRRNNLAARWAARVGNGSGNVVRPSCFEESMRIIVDDRNPSITYLAKKHNVEHGFAIGKFIEYCDNNKNIREMLEERHGVICIS